jgi:hypothetical protein
MSSPTIAKSLSSFEKLPPLGILQLIVFSVATLGIYTWWWMYSRSMLLNEVLPTERRLNTGFMRFCLSGFAVTLVLAVVAGFQLDNVALAGTVNLLSLLLNIMVIVWVLHFRRAANHLLGEQETPYHFHLFWTLLFQVFYMQYKINLIHSHSRTGVM